MSSGSVVKTVGVREFQEWLVSLGLLEPSEVQGTERGAEDFDVRDKLRDGVVLCHLVNKIRPGSVDNIKPKRSSGDAEENILRFLQACTTMGIKKIFRPADLLGPTKDTGCVMVTLQLLYNVGVDHGLGLKVAPKPAEPQSENGLSPGGSEGAPDEEEADEGPIKVVRAVYAFSGASEDELQFNNGDVIKVTKIVEGGWWEGSCNGSVGWFPSAFIQEIEDGDEAVASNEDDDAHHYYKLVVLDILESERAFVQGLNDMLSRYLYPLKASSVLQPREVDQLTGNLPELTKRQQNILVQLEECSKLSVPKQNIGATFLDCKQEVEALYATYCANHPQAVAVLTENSDKLSEFMESKGAASPGMLTLTSGLSKPFRRLEKYSGLLMELHRQMEGHTDSDNVEAASTAYKAVATHTQEIRKRKEMEHEMLSSPVKGFNGSCLNELGECRCVIVANQALNAEEVEEVYFLVFLANFIILGVGQSLSGYEIKSNLSLGSVSVKKAKHSEQWPWPVEIQHKSDVVHASLASEADQCLLLDMVGRVESARTPTTPRTPHVLSIIAGSKALSRADSAQIFKTAYPTRRSSVNIQRQHHWGFKSLRPAPPLTTQQLIALRERDKSPKLAKKFNYPNVKKKRASKHMEELLASAGSLKFPVENKAGDSIILKVIEAYCAGGRGAIHSDEPKTYISRLKKSSSMDRQTPRPQGYTTFESPESKKFSKSSTLPAHRSNTNPFPQPPMFTRPPNLDLPGFPYRAPSPIHSPGDMSRQGGASPVVGGGRSPVVGGAAGAGKSASSKRSIFRRRADSVDNAKIRHH